MNDQGTSKYTIAKKLQDIHGLNHLSSRREERFPFQEESKEDVTFGYGYNP
jgi:hypothetical protein